jgi:hypothetical protein
VNVRQSGCAAREILFNLPQSLAHYLELAFHGRLQQLAPPKLLQALARAERTSEFDGMDDVPQASRSRCIQ